MKVRYFFPFLYPPDLSFEVLMLAPFVCDETVLQPMSSRRRGLTYGYFRGVLAASAPKSS